MIQNKKIPAYRFQVCRGFSIFRLFLVLFLHFHGAVGDAALADPGSQERCELQGEEPLVRVDVHDLPRREVLSVDLRIEPEPYLVSESELLHADKTVSLAFHTILLFLSRVPEKGRKNRPTINGHHLSIPVHPILTAVPFRYFCFLPLTYWFTYCLVKK